MIGKIHITQKIDNVLTCVFLVCMQTYFWIGMTEFEEMPGFGIIGYILYFCALSIVLFKLLVHIDFNIWSISFITIVGILGVICRFHVVNDVLFKIFLYGIALKGTTLRKTYIYYVASNMGVFLTVFVCSIIGIIPNTKRLEGNWSIYSFGFSNPNTWGMLITVCLMGYCYLVKDKVNYLRIAFITTATLIMYGYCHSRGCLFTLLIFYVLVLVEIKFKLFDFIAGKRILMGSICLLFPAISYLSYYLAANYFFSAFIKKLDNYFTWRFYLWSFYWFTAVPGVFAKLDTQRFIYRSLDNGYLVLFYKVGILAYFVYLFVFCLCILQSYKKRDGYALTIILAYFPLLFIEGLPVFCQLSLVLIYGLCQVMNAEPKYPNQIQ